MGKPYIHSAPLHILCFQWACQWGFKNFSLLGKEGYLWLASIHFVNIFESTNMLWISKKKKNSIPILYLTELWNCSTFFRTELNFSKFFRQSAQHYVDHTVNTIHTKTVYMFTVAHNTVLYIMYNFKSSAVHSKSHVSPHFIHSSIFFKTKDVLGCKKILGNKLIHLQKFFILKKTLQLDLKQDNRTSIGKFLRCFQLLRAAKDGSTETK